MGGERRGKLARVNALNSGHGLAMSRASARSMHSATELA
jgi:hypothetical protein